VRVVVTGADGFAGRWLCRALAADGLWVSGWTRRFPDAPVSGIHYRIQDVRDRAGCARAMAEDQPHQVFHLAAVTHLASAERDPTAAHDVNVGGTHNVFSTMPTTAVGVHASTCHVYGPPLRLPVDEHHPLHPVGVYPTTKALSETAAREAAPKVVIARAFHHTGPGQSPAYALAGWAQQLAQGLSPIRVGDLRLRRDYSDVRDIVAGYRLLADSGIHKAVYNLCSGEGTPLQDFLDGLNGGMPPAVEVVSNRIRPSDIGEFRGDPAKAAALGWRPEVDRLHMLADLRASFAPVSPREHP
jgi:GDP-4-dehydro-6-deoxy-D-mannose reductase